MKITIGDYLKEKYPQSCSVWGMPVFGAALLTINVLKLPDVQVSELFLHIFTYLGVALLGCFLLIIVFETLSKLFLSLKKVVNLLLIIPKMLFRGYVFIIKFLIKRSVIEILEDKGNFVSEDFILRKPSSDKDDDYWGKLINFNEIKKLELIITPSKETVYWRAGLKFSQNEVFTSARYGPNFPLFHLTKDVNENTLKLHYYNEQGSRSTAHKDILMNDYKNDQVKLLVEVKKGLKDVLNITVINSNKKTLFEDKFNLSSHRYARLFAWGDGQNYEINIRNHIEQ